MADDAALVQRTEPEWATDERTTLLQFLAYYRTTLQRQASAVSDAQAATASVEPSMLTLTGLIRHMTEVERSWLRRCFAGEAIGPQYYSDERPDGDLEVDESMSVAETIAEWRREIERCDAVIADVIDMNEVAAGRSHAGGRPNLRWVIVHLIEEYARHCGHADLIRERIDGSVDL